MLAGGLGILSFPSLGFYEGSKFRFAYLQYDGNWDTRPRAYKRLISSLELRTSIKTSYERKILSVNDPDLFHYPFLYLCGDTRFTPFSAQERRVLRKFLKLGGTLLIDDTSGEYNSPFDSQIKEELALILPENPLSQLPLGHVVYKTFYLLHSANGRKIVNPYLQGVTFKDEDRTAVIYCQNDLGGAWSEDELGKWEFECTPGGEAQRELAFRMGINTVLYALTGNYKKDQIHVPFIQRRQMRL